MTDKRKKRAARKKRTSVEKLLAETRRKPSPTCRDPKQIDLVDYINQRDLADSISRQAFANLDREIAAMLGTDKPEGDT